MSSYLKNSLNPNTSRLGSSKRSSCKCRSIPQVRGKHNHEHLAGQLKILKGANCTDTVDHFRDKGESVKLDAEFEMKVNSGDK